MSSRETEFSGKCTFGMPLYLVREASQVHREVCIEAHNTPSWIIYAVHCVNEIVYLFMVNKLPDLQSVHVVILLGSLVTAGVRERPACLCLM